MTYEQKKYPNINIVLGFLFFSLFILFALLICNLATTGYLVYKVQSSTTSQNTAKWYGERSTQFISPAVWIPLDEIPLAYQVTDMERATIDVPSDQVHIEKGDGKTFLRFFEGNGGRYYWPNDLDIEMITEVSKLNNPVVLEFEVTKYVHSKGWFLVVETVTIKK